MRVICVKHGTKYGSEWVINLQRMVARHLPIPHDFVCLTEKPVTGIECRPLPSDLPGWWAKVGLFKPELLPGDNLYLDLDVVVWDSLLPLVALLYKSPGLWARDDFSYPVRNPRQGLGADSLKLLGGPGCVNSSIMLWHGDSCSDVWDKFDRRTMGVMHGDQNWISNALRGRINFIPDELASSYKYQVMRGEPVGNIVVFHGDPKVHQLHSKDPLRVAWES